jgi:hypothetical protein
LWLRPLLPLGKHGLVAQRVADMAAERFPERWIHLFDAADAWRVRRWLGAEPLTAAGLGGTGFPMAMALVRLEEATGAVGVLDEALVGATFFYCSRVGYLRGGRRSHRSLRAVQ